MIKWLKEVLGLEAKPKTAHIAKERLMVIVAHERTQHSEPDFLPMLQKEITEVIAKYVHVDEKQVSVEFEQRGGRSILELNITLPEGTKAKLAKASTKVKTPLSAITSEAAADHHDQVQSRAVKPVVKPEHKSKHK